ncbi:MAG: tetratricopeptide repeat protein [Planctomycetes bacterium]|nr:tetratricopeptide repeat protein [Planctomycetota bacterium]
MHRLASSIAVLATLAIADARACINEYGTSVDGSVKARSHIHGSVPGSLPVNADYYRKQVKSLSPRLAHSPTHEELSDLAVAYLYLGKTDRAIELLVQAEAQKPNEYVIASNLGTAYELAGRNVEALKWIEEGIRLNPGSHDGSEWIHANLLRAKIAMKDDPEWIRSNSVTGLHFGNGPIPDFDATLSRPNCPKSPEVITSHLWHQLSERRKFIPGPDPIVAALMFDLANATALSDTVEDALPIYVAARDLGYDDTVLLNKRFGELKKRQRGNLLMGWSLDSIASFAVGLAFFLGFCVWRARYAMLRSARVS